MNLKISEKNSEIKFFAIMHTNAHAFAQAHANAIANANANAYDSSVYLANTADDEAQQKEGRDI